VPFQPSSTPGKHFTTFHSAAEEARFRTDEREPLKALSGRIVQTPRARSPYKAVLSHAGHADTARAFDTICEAEAFIRLNTPTNGPPLSKLYDRQAGEA